MSDAPPPPSRIGRRATIGALFGLGLYVALSLWRDLDDVGAALARIPWWAPLLMCGLSLANYAVRFPRWQRYLELVGSPTRGAASARIYLSGLSLTVSPGKLGEAVKSWTLREHDGTPIARSAPIVLAERVTDLFGFLVLIALFGAIGLGDGAVDGAHVGVVLASLALGAGAAACVGSGRARGALMAVARRVPLVARRADRLEESLESAAALVSPRELARATPIAALGWGLECVGAWLVAASVVDGPLPWGGALGLGAVGYAFALAAVAGALVVVAPGGLGVTEGVLVALLARGYGDGGAEDAVALALSVTIVVRLCTLWFGMAVGLAALGLQRRARR